MGRIFGGDDDDDVDPTGPTVDYNRGRKQKKHVDPDATTAMRYRDTDDEDEDDEALTIRPGRRLAKDLDEAPVLPVGWLVIVEGPGRGYAAALQTGLNRIGRDKSEQVALDFDDREISRMDHFRVNYNRMSRKFHILPGQGAEVWLKRDAIDAVLEKEALHSGDLITVGKTTLRFVPFCGDSFDWHEKVPE